MQLLPFFHGLPRPGGRGDCLGKDFLSPFLCGLEKGGGDHPGRVKRLFNNLVLLPAASKGGGRQSPTIKSSHLNLTAELWTT